MSGVAHNKSTATSQAAEIVRPRRTWRKVASRVVTVLLVAAVVGYLVHDWPNVVKLLALKPVYLLLVLGLNLANVVLFSAKLRLFIVHLAHKRVGLGRWFNIFIMGQLLNMVLPQGGNVYRAMTLKSEFSLSATSYVGGFLAMAWLDVLLTLLLGAALLFIRLWSNFEAMVVALTLMGLFVVIAVTPWIGLWLLKRVHPRSNLLCRVRSRLITGYDSLLLVMHRPRMPLDFLLLDVLSFITVVLMMYGAFAGVGYSITLWQVIVLYTLVKASTMVQLTPGNLGVRELAVGALSAAVSVDIGAAMLVTLLIRVANYVALVLAACPFLVTKLASSIRRNDTDTDGFAPPDSPVGPKPL